eukprot:gene33575-40617_t
MHKYAASLAATEPYRLQCLQDLSKRINPFHRLAGFVKGKSIFEQADELRGKDKKLDEILVKFEQRVQNTLKSYGINVQHFNEMSNTLSKQTDARKKVLLQAYLYKITADLEGNLHSSLPYLPPLDTVQSLRLKGDGRTASREDKLRSSLTIKRYAQVLREIENCRLHMRDKIKRELNLDSLPPRMCDPKYLPAMSPLIQRASADFPVLAQRIVAAYQLDVPDFNALQDRMQRNAVFRWRVSMALREVEKEKKKAAIVAAAPVVAPAEPKAAATSK